MASKTLNTIAIKVNFGIIQLKITGSEVNEKSFDIYEKISS